MSILTLVRHAQASYMSTDYDRLSPLGEEQARKLGQFWARHRLLFQQVFHGPAQRHVRTMEIASEEVREAGLPWPEPAALAELDEFDAYQMMKTIMPILIDRNEKVRRLNDEFRANEESPEAGRLLQKLFEEAARQWCSGEFPEAEVESWPQFQARIAGAIHRIRASTPKSTSTVVFTSGGPIAATLAQVLCLSPAKAIEFVWLSRNCSWSEFVFSGDRFSLSAYNSFPHLDDVSLLTYR
jgi:broad specificity phosphatase PhoE